MQDQETFDKLDQVWQSIGKLCESLTEREWKMPTDCPGWTVQDNVAHIVDYESRLLGRPVPEHTPPQRPHMKNDLGKRNEIWVDWWRSQTGAQVLDAFREVTAERLRVLPTLSAEALAALSPISSRGEALRDHLARRVVDCWAHEQDIRRAVSRPGHDTGAVVAHVMDRMLGGLGPVVAQRAGAPPDSTVVVALTGPYRRTLALRVEGDRATSCDPIPDLPTVRLSMDSETFACLCFGRWDAEKVLESGRVLFAGDRELGRTIVRQMTVTP
jgi:uncharacterized protein (TIGR03083 family)